MGHFSQKVRYNVKYFYNKTKWYLINVNIAIITPNSELNLHLDILVPSGRLHQCVYFYIVKWIGLNKVHILQETPLNEQGSTEF